MPPFRTVRIAILSSWLTAAAFSSTPAAAALAASTSAGRAADPAAQALLAGVVKECASYRDFEARFRETAISRATGPGTPETGIVFFKRPDLWRWEYRSPEKKVVVVRGKVAVISLEGADGADEHARYELGEDEESSGIGRLLAGGDAVARAFIARFEPAGPEAGGETATLRLDPVVLSDQYDHIVLRVRVPDLRIIEAVVVDPAGNRLRFEFEGFVPDRGLSESLFDLPGSKAAQP